MRDTSMAETANLLLKDGKRHQAFDYIFGEIDRLLREKKFRKIDLILRNINPRDYDTAVNIAFLSATLPAKKVLGQREDFYNRVEESFKGLLKGLK